MADLLVLAFRADLTRVATFVLANDGSNRSYREIGAAEGRQDLSHHGGDREKQEKIRDFLLDATRRSHCFYAEGVVVSKPRVARLGELPWGTKLPDRGCITSKECVGWDEV
jgi:Protein of unknown function (DUF1552)